MAANKATETANLLKRRIKNGVYATTPLPGAPALAQELGVSYVTIRNAMRILLDDHAVYQMKNGRLRVCENVEPTLKVAFITPPVYPNENKWVKAVHCSAEKFNCIFHHVIVPDSTGKTVFDVLDGDYDIIFMISLEWNPVLLNKMKKIKERIVTVYNNFTHLGFRCFDGYSPEVLDILFAYLARRGYKKIDYFSVNTCTPTGNWRYVQWNKALAKYGFSGKAYHAEIVPPEPLQQRALSLFREHFSQNAFDDTEVIFAGSPGVARAILRGLADAKVRVPEDIAVVSVGEPEVATFNTPSITGIGTPDLQEKSDEIFKHYLGIAVQPGKLLYNHPASELKEIDNILFIGETTR